MSTCNACSTNALSLIPKYAWARHSLGGESQTVKLRNTNKHLAQNVHWRQKLGKEGEGGGGGEGRGGEGGGERGKSGKTREEMRGNEGREEKEEGRKGGERRRKKGRREKKEERGGGRGHLKAVQVCFLQPTLVFSPSHWLQKQEHSVTSPVLQMGFVGER